MFCWGGGGGSLFCVLLGRGLFFVFFILRFVREGVLCVLLWGGGGGLYSVFC